MGLHWALVQEFQICCRIGGRPIRKHVSTMCAPGVRPVSLQLNNDGPLRKLTPVSCSPFHVMCMEFLYTGGECAQSAPEKGILRHFRIQEWN